MPYLFGDDDDDEKTRASGTRKKAREPGSLTHSRVLAWLTLLAARNGELPHYYNNESKYTSLHEIKTLLAQSHPLDIASLVGDKESLEHNFLCYLNKRITGVCGNSTLVILVSGHHDVALHSPVGPPGVFDQPVILPFICTVSYNENRVVKISAAAASESKTKIVA